MKGFQLKREFCFKITSLMSKFHETIVVVRLSLSPKTQLFLFFTSKPKESQK